LNYKSNISVSIFCYLSSPNLYAQDTPVASGILPALAATGTLSPGSQPCKYCGYEYGPILNRYIQEKLGTYIKHLNSTPDEYSGIGNPRGDS
jgi:hypothetical protein